MKVLFITGCAKGLGRCIANAALERGDAVVACARNPELLKDLVEKYGAEKVLPLRLDITSFEEAQAAVKMAIEKFGRIDVLVNNAGFGFCGAAEEETQEDIHRVIEGNLFGPINVTRAALPILREQHAGHIVQISSVAGRITIPGYTLYCAAKFGLEGFSEALAQEMKPLGVKVTIIEPGSFRTNFAPSITFAQKQIADYDQSVGVIRNLIRGGYRGDGDPDKMAAAIIKVVEDADPPLRILLGKDAISLVPPAEQAKVVEGEKWRSLSLSTDVDKVGEVGADLLVGLVSKKDGDLSQGEKQPVSGVAPPVAETTPTTSIGKGGFFSPKSSTADVAKQAPIPVP